MVEAVNKIEPAAGASGFTASDNADKLAYEDYARCIHCGLCLNHCPTYRLWGLEADSPRGRIRQMLLVDQGKLELGDSFVRHIDQCLDCRACETACPSGVEYGKLVEVARAQIEQNYRRPIFSRLARSLVFRHILPHPPRCAAHAAGYGGRRGCAPHARSWAGRRSLRAAPAQLTQARRSRLQL